MQKIKYPKYSILYIWNKNKFKFYFLITFIKILHKNSQSNNNIIQFKLIFQFNHKIIFYISKSNKFRKQINTWKHFLNP